MTLRFLSLAFGAGWCLVGCAHSPGGELRERLDVTSREAAPERLVRKAQSFAAAGDYTRAEQYLNAARAQGADEAQLLPLLIEVCISDQRYRSATQYAEDYLRRHPKDHDLRYLLGTLYSATGDAVRASQELERLLAEDPSHADAHFALAVVLRDQLASFARSDQQFREYLRLRPDGAHAEEAAESLLEKVQ